MSSKRGHHTHTHTEESTEVNRSPQMFSLKSEERTGADPNEYISVQLWKQIVLDHLLRVKGSWNWNSISSLNPILFSQLFNTLHGPALGLPNQHTQYEQFTAIKPCSL